MLLLLNYHRLDPRSAPTLEKIDFNYRYLKLRRWLELDMAFFLVFDMWRTWSVTFLQTASLYNPKPCSQFRQGWRHTTMHDSIMAILDGLGRYYVFASGIRGDRRTLQQHWRRFCEWFKALYKFKCLSVQIWIRPPGGSILPQVHFAPNCLSLLLHRACSWRRCCPLQKEKAVTNAKFLALKDFMSVGSVLGTVLGLSF